MISLYWHWVPSQVDDHRCIVNMRMRLSCPRGLLEKHWLNADWVLFVRRRSKEGLGSILHSLCCWWLCILCVLCIQRALGSSGCWALTVSRACAWNDVLQHQQVVLSLCIRKGGKEGSSRTGLPLHLRGRLLLAVVKCEVRWLISARRRYQSAEWQCFCTASWQLSWNELFTGENVWVLIFLQLLFCMLFDNVFWYKSMFSFELAVRNWEPSGKPPEQSRQCFSRPTPLRYQLKDLAAYISLYKWREKGDVCCQRRCVQVASLLLLH